ncbi:hypothetical protein Ciccas_012257, partial [Cichlidogyrus casuarinus]
MTVYSEFIHAKKIVNVSATNESLSVITNTFDVSSLKTLHRLIKAPVEKCSGSNKIIETYEKDLSQFDLAEEVRKVVKEKLTITNFLDKCAMLWIFLVHYNGQDFIVLCKLFF